LPEVDFEEVRVMLLEDGAKRCWKPEEGAELGGKDIAVVDYEPGLGGKDLSVAVGFREDPETAIRERQSSS